MTRNKQELHIKQVQCPQNSDALEGQAQGKACGGLVPGTRPVCSFAEATVWVAHWEGLEFTDFRHVFFLVEMAAS